ncbi:YggT family protein [Corynebacterium auriscanis]|uniref:Membrane protein n=1 Tax=Corynebacterium auriscanis TaxID=99807 RepID=A0A0A2DN25_9CORY|nr:YggT family protein [Corynebacterium auriscanis]KGM19187.1 membrane protein [Corynebacterium auriscanis]WJY72487.1 YGGT family protein [Corynebacterium auriscanis]
MNSAIVLLILLLKLYILVLILRIIIEMVQSFSRNWRPQRWFSICAEPIFVVTDPPVKALRKLIPPVQLGGVGLDVSVLVLFFILQLLMMILGRMSAL